MQNVTRKILDCFDRINTIPRCSRNEAALCRWLQEWARSRGYAMQADAAGNLTVRVPASPGCEAAAPVILQAHMDMVCEKRPDSGHDFNRDPIRSHVRGDWLTADGTTLGADNGIAIAYILVLVEDPGLRHPALELLFTVDEETGLTGVKKLGAGMLTAKRFINLDSEDEGIFTVGCAGGQESRITLDVSAEPIPAGWSLHKIVVGGLKGGHSGIDIHRPRANANKVLARALARIRTESVSRVAALTGGTRHNAIARDAEAVIACPPEESDDIRRAVAETEQIVRREYANGDPAIVIEVLDPGAAPGMALNLEETDRLIWLLLSLPHGVAGFSPTVPGAVETSSNLATVSVADGRVNILSSQRSSDKRKLEKITAVITATADMAGAAIQGLNNYPAWPPEKSSELLRLSKTVYSQLFHREPIIQVIHAGLECAIVRDLYPGMDMISFGPTIRNPHSPDESIYIPSIEHVWNFLVALLARMSSE